MSVSGDAVPRKSKDCATCGRSVLQSTEQHVDCFDCLGHGPLSAPEDRCQICVSWVAKHWLAATALYPSAERIRQEAISLDPNLLVASVRSGVSGTQDTAMPQPVAGPSSTRQNGSEEKCVVGWGDFNPPHTSPTSTPLVAK